MMQWATALAPSMSPGGRLGPGHRQGKWPWWWPERELGGLGVLCGVAAALHQRYRLSWQNPGVLLPVFPGERDSENGAQNLNVEPD